MAFIAAVFVIMLFWVAIDMMQIIVNGDAIEVPEGLTAAGLVERLELAGKRLAMEINLEIVPRSSYDAVMLNPGDRVEVVHAIGGG